MNYSKYIDFFHTVSTVSTIGILYEYDVNSIIGNIKKLLKIKKTEIEFLINGMQ